MALSLDADLRKEKSIKHLEKIQKLKKIAGYETSTKVEPPLKYFSTDETLSIGGGSGGTSVFVGIMEDDSEVAVKRMLVACEAFAENEKKILNLIETKKSPFIVSYRHFFRDNPFIYLIVDLCEETLKEHVSSQNAEYLLQHGRRMIKEILTGLDFLHKKRILHRDLKPSNILVDVDGHMRLADFGISRVLNDDETTVLTDNKGTQGWMAREVIETIREGGKVHFKKKSDVQVAGMIAHFILTKGGHPFGDKLVRMANIVNGNPVHLGKLDDPDDHRFVSWLISHNIKDRPYAHEALETLENLHKGNVPGGGGQMLAGTEESNQPTSSVSQHLHVTVALETLENLPKDPYRLSHPGIIPFESLAFNENERELGRGAFGVVRKAKLTRPFGDHHKIHSPMDVAVRCLRDNASKIYVEDSFEQEAINLMKLQNQFIVRFLGVSYNEKDNLMLVTELVPQGSLDNYLRDPKNLNILGNEVLLQFAIQITIGMKYLEAKKFVHGNLAARNILVATEAHVKIGCFGVRRIYDDEYYRSHREQKFPVRWLAPEYLEQKKNTSHSDVWSLGVTLWEMFSYGKRPYEGWNFDSASGLMKLLKSGVQLSRPPACPEEIYAYVRECWDLVPQRRISFFLLKTLLEDILKDKYSKKPYFM